MLIGKRKFWISFTLIGVGMLWVVGACASPAPTATPVMYVPPLLPGPVTTLNDGMVMVEPKLSDDYFPNPGIGWQNGPKTPSTLQMPETVAYATRRDIAWSVLNPADGVYDFSILEQKLQSAITDGKQFSFRVYTMVGEGISGSMVPDWVLAKGASILSSGEPDYSSCVYQEEWGNFVNELIRVYDGNPYISFIDISGYGNFNEWSWQDLQTEWDDGWKEGYLAGSTSSGLFKTLDGQARRRLADMFIGGSFDEHQCRLADGEISTVSYSYPGFHKTQLIMPYAGIIQSSQYVFSRRSDVGLRYDCLGREGEHVMEKIGDIIDRLWMTEPVVFEFCTPEQFNVDDARRFLQMGHASLVHDNNWKYDTDLLKGLLRDVGYRYFLKTATLSVEDRKVMLQMDWQNIGNAPNYPSLGQDFQLYFYLVDNAGVIAYQEPIQTDVDQWLPSESPIDAPRTYSISQAILLPKEFPGGMYFAGVSIVDRRTGKPINLAFGGKDPAGWHYLMPLAIK